MLKPTLKQLLGAACATSLILLTGLPAAFAEERVCRGSLGAITVDNLRVPSGASCTLTRTRVKGSIVVQRNAHLVAKGVRVIGNVQAEDAARVVVADNSRVGGSVQLVQGGRAHVSATTINGDLLYDENTGPLRAADNTIGGNLQAFQNTGGVAIIGNVIDGNLQCKANAPAPTGGGNIVQGNKEDQCRNL